MQTFPTLSDPTYRIEAELGAGGGGVVYKAWHTRLQKHVVLKRIKDESGLIHAERQRGETDILKNLKHAHLPQLYDFLTDESGVYTVMEYIPGQSFAALLKEKQTFTQPQIVRWAAQLADALAYLHGQNPPVLHSDIKPGNIMLTPDGEICLIDFNISLVLDGDEAQALGLSHGYASPEQYGPQGLPRDMQIVPRSKTASTHVSDTDARTIVDKFEQTVMDTSVQTIVDGSMETMLDTGVKPVPETPSSSAQRRTKIRMDMRSDIYSLGATLYHLAAREKPAIATGDIVPLHARSVPFSEAFTYIIERCMERDPSLRFQTAADLHDAFANIHKLDGRWKRQRAKTAAASVVLTALFAASCGAAFWGWTRMGSEKVEAFNNHVLAIADTDTAYDAAIVLFPENPAAYQAQAVKLCRPGSYEVCVEYVKSVMAKLSAYPQDEAGLRQIGNIYYAQGNAYFELDEYPNAVLAYEAAIANNPDNPEMYRDYAIALARCGYIDRAEALLHDVRDMDLATVSVRLLQGEIVFAKGNDAEAITLFQEVLQNADDINLRNRTVLICDKAYRNLPERIEEEIALLRDALDILPANYALILKERLADALVRSGGYAEAAALFEEIRQNGSISYQTWQNIGVLYQQMGEFAKARALYAELQAAYPDDYRPLLRMAYLSLEEQAALPNEERAYEDAAALYDRAKALCRTDDAELLQLAGIITELRQNGWID